LKEKHKTVASDAAAGDFFGSSVALFGDTRLSAHEKVKPKATYPAPCTCLLEMEMGNGNSSRNSLRVTARLDVSLAPA